MIVVTGGAGFIGANLARALNRRGHDDILLVDELTDPRKLRNISDLRIAESIGKDEFLDLFVRIDKIESVFHLGACTDTTEIDENFIMKTNYVYSKELFEKGRRRRIPIIYASSAAVYGNSRIFSEDSAHERPLNAYAYSKWLFDCHVRRSVTENDPPVVGLRYFNVYGPGEGHKDHMASIPYRLHNQITGGESPKLFGSADGYGPGEQRRDFVHVDDAVDVTVWCWEHGVRGILNCGTGHSETFRAVAEAVIAAHGRGSIEYIDFPPALEGRYQSCTQADLARLRRAGYAGRFRDATSGVREYVEWLIKTPS